MTDTEILRRILLYRSPNSWASHPEILQESIARSGHGMTVHSRVADLRKQGYTVECRIETHAGRKVSFYRIVL